MHTIRASNIRLLVLVLGASTVLANFLKYRLFFVAGTRRYLHMNNTQLNTHGVTYTLDLHCCHAFGLTAASRVPIYSSYSHSYALP